MVKKVSSKRENVSILKQYSRPFYSPARPYWADCKKHSISAFPQERKKQAQEKFETYRKILTFFSHQRLIFATLFFLEKSDPDVEIFMLIFKNIASLKMIFLILKLSKNLPLKSTLSFLRSLFVPDFLPTRQPLNIIFNFTT